MYTASDAVKYATHDKRVLEMLDTIIDGDHPCTVHSDMNPAPSDSILHHYQHYHDLLILNRVFTPNELVGFEQNEEQYFLTHIASPILNNRGQIRDDPFEHSYFIYLADDNLEAFKVKNFHLYKFISN